MNVEQEIQSLKEQMTAGEKNKLSMVVFSGDLDKLIGAFIIATGAVAMGLEVVMFFTFWGTTALRDKKKKGRGKDFLGKMFGFMLPKGASKLKISNMNMGGAGTAMIKHIMKKKNVLSLPELIELAAELEVKIVICEMSMDLMGMKTEEMIDYPGMEIGGAAKFLEQAKESGIQLFI